MTKRRSVSRTKKSPPSSKPPRHGWALFRLWLFYSVIAILVLLAIWTLYLDVVVRAKFDGKKWALPARVYSRPLELYEGLALTPPLFEQELQALGYRAVGNLNAPGQYVKRPVSSGQVSYQVHSRGFDFWDKREEARRFSITIANGHVMHLRDLAGADMPLMRLEPEEIGGIYPAEAEDRLLVRLSDLPPLLGETLLAVEDQHFLDHHGVSPLAILRAAMVNVREGEVVQGGSTLTQQLVKNFYLTRERHLRRKVQEAIMAVLLEIHYTKSEILETYINEVFLGQSGPRAIHGFALASQHYYRQPLAELDTEQLALLVGLVKGASYYNPWRNPERAKKRRNLVLTVMHQQGLIDDKELKRAQAAPLGVVEQGDTSMVTYPAFVALVKRQLQEDYQEEDLRSEGLRIFTSLSPMVQRQAEAALNQRLRQLEQRHNVKDLQGSMVVTSVGGGEVLALIGDKNPRFEGFNRALDARRPIGSLMKPFVYLTALEQPDSYHLGTLISDDPVTIKGDNGKLWEPKNVDSVSHGEVPMYMALTHSYNQATARLGMQLGLENVYDTVKAAGFEGRIPGVPSMLLGSVDMSAFDVAGIYHTLAAEGVYTPLRSIREVLTADGQPLRRYPLELEQRFSLESTFQLQYALQMVLREGTGRSVYNQFPESLPLAGKTGTTNDQRDSWFAGFSGEHLAVVWLGRDDNSATPLTGSGGALQVWADLMRQLPTQGVNLQPPEGVSFDWIDAATGMLSAEHCEGAVWLPLRDSQRPEQQSDCRLKEGGRNWWQRLWN
ncbi:MAG TPA: penicillin-binding protein 1B [Cellvibrio sp.]|nr:penicillin-binding protein 1B [Cellvibrio sp.]